MSFDVLNTVASLGTLAVITATAGAAIVQLRHLRSSNQIALLSKLHDTLQSPEFVHARRFIVDELPALLRDPVLRASLHTALRREDFRPAYMLGNFYENVGMFVRLGIVERTTVCELWNGVIEDAWLNLAYFLAIVRSEPRNFDVWENFEYLAMTVEDWKKRHPGGDYPRGARRLLLPSPGDPPG